MCEQVLVLLEIIIADNLPHAKILGDTSLRKGRGQMDLYRKMK